MTTPQRIALALAACEGLSDDDLAQRGPAGFKKMILRKRHYAGIARELVIAVQDSQKALKAASTKLKQANENVDELKALDKLDVAPIDTAQAAAMIAAVSGKKAAE